MGHKEDEGRDQRSVPRKKKGGTVPMPPGPMHGHGSGAAGYLRHGPEQVLKSGSDKSHTEMG